MGHKSLNLVHPSLVGWWMTAESSAAIADFASLRGVHEVITTLTCGSSGVGVCSTETKISSCRSSATSQAPSKTLTDGRRCLAPLLSILLVVQRSICRVICHSRDLQHSGCCYLLYNHRFRTSRAYFSSFPVFETLALLQLASNLHFPEFSSRQDVGWSRNVLFRGLNAT